MRTVLLVPPFSCTTPILKMEIWLAVIAGMVVLAPSGRVSASAKRKEKGVVW